MIWILVTILFSADGTWQAFEYTDEPAPFHTEAACMDAGTILLDGDGDNEKFVCAAVNPGASSE